MVKTALTNSLIDSGRRIVDELDSAGINVDAALWFYWQEPEAWKLLLSLPELIKAGPKSAYQKVQSLLARIPEKADVDLDDISIAAPDAPLLGLLRSTIRTGEGKNGIRFTRNVVNGVPIEDAFIYRL